MTDDAEALPLRLVEEMAHLISTSISEIVPPEAQLHFLNAQRELLIAVYLTIEHNSQRSFRSPRATPRRRAAERTAEARTRTAATSRTGAKRTGAKRRSAAETPPPPDDNPRRPQRISLD